MAGLKKGRIVLAPNDYRNLCTQVRHRDNWKCRVCKRRQNLVQHHIVYRSHQGDDADWNLITLCGKCHDGIHRPHPSSGAMLIIMPLVEGEPIDANGIVKFYFHAGWKPGGM